MNGTNVIMWSFFTKFIISISHTLIILLMIIKNECKTIFFWSDRLKIDVISR
jgi:hypothetical protein